MKQPSQGGSYVYDVKRNDLKQVEKPTVHRNPNDKPAPTVVAPAENQTVEEAEALKKGN